MAEGLCRIDADVVRIPQSGNPNLKALHMKWAQIRVNNPSAFFPSASERERCHFAHSYGIVYDGSEDVVTAVHYGSNLIWAVQSGTVHEAQFHLNKSRRFGIRMLQAFAEV